MEIKRTFLRAWIPRLHISWRLIRWVGGIVVYSSLIALVRDNFPVFKWASGDEWAATTGLVLGSLLVFRNKESYDRWWEARKLWGQLINDTRNLVMKVRAHADVSPSAQAEVGWLSIHFANALRLHLQRIQSFADEPALAALAEKAEHLPLYISGLIHDKLGQWNRDGKLGNSLYVIDPHARALMDICGSCERIRNSPIPESYRALLRQFIVIYILLAPWSLIAEEGTLAIPALAVLFYFLLGIELTAETVEQPFGHTADDLPLADFCRTIEKSVGAVLDLAPEGNAVRSNS